MGPCVRSLLAQQGLAAWEVVVLDDGSTDATADVVRNAARDDPHLRLATGSPLPAGWLGKPHACQQLADLADPASRVLVFVDADVVLAPTAVAAAMALLGDFDLLTPYPLIVARDAGERLIQPLLAWSWLTFLPLRAMERSRQPLLAAAGGQLLVVRRSGYDRAGGHGAVRNRVLEDVNLARAIKRSGGRIALADGSTLATCRMYPSWADLVAGYTKSLWSAFPSPLAGLGVVLGLALLYSAPPVVAAGAALVGAWEWAIAATMAYLLGVAGRTVSARATGGRTWPDAWAQPLSVCALAWLLWRSYRDHRHGRLTWKGRPVT